MAEAERMKFIRANISIFVPGPFPCNNAYRDDETGQAVNIIDYVEGQTFKQRGQTLPKQDRTRSFPSFVATWLSFAALRRFHRYFCERPEGYGLYQTEQEFNEDMVKAMKDSKSGFARWRCSVWLSIMKDDDIALAHSDFDPRNILVQGDKVTAILNWEMSGYYSTSWEYGNALLRPGSEGAWSRSKAVDKILEAFHKELTVMSMLSELQY
ncbi:hypothetical protein J3459_014802 [Metarhizium acridum]|nr:hypothetical protein J3459_014802 [Metarhizium acridum]